MHIEALLFVLFMLLWGMAIVLYRLMRKWTHKAFAAQLAAEPGKSDNLAALRSAARKANARSLRMLFLMAIVWLSLLLMLGSSSNFALVTLTFTGLMLLFGAVSFKLNAALGTKGPALHRLLERVMEVGSAKQVDLLAQRILQTGSSPEKAEGLELLEAWGGQEAIHYLEGLLHREPDASPALGSILTWLRDQVATAQNGHPHPLFIFAERQQCYRRLGQAAAAPGLQALQTLLPDEQHPLYAPYHRQWKLHQNLHELFCRDCHSRAERWDNGLYTAIQCRRCHWDRGLEFGVEQVRGLIGDTSDGERHGGILEYQLWDRKSRQARSIEVDTLRFGDLPPEEMEWAVAAVLEVLVNEYPAYRLPILLENKPPEGLSENAKRALGKLCRYSEDRETVPG